MPTSWHACKSRPWPWMAARSIRTRPICAAAVVAGRTISARRSCCATAPTTSLPGVHVIVPLRIAGSDAAVLVDRGWIPYEMSNPEQRKVFQDATGAVEVHGILRRSQPRRSSLSPADPPLGPERPRLDAWYRVEVPRIQEQVPYRLLPVFLEEETGGRRTRPTLPPSRSRHRAQRRPAPGLCDPVVRVRGHPAGRLHPVVSPANDARVICTKVRKGLDKASQSG